MKSEQVLDLRDCTEYRTALLTRPPRTTRYLVGLLAALLASAVVWAALSEIDVLVTAPAVVRPPEAPQELRVPRDAEVAEVFFREGDEVALGDVLLRLRTDKIEQEIARLNLDIASTRGDAERRRAVKLAIEQADEQARVQAQTAIEVAQLELERARERQQVAVSNLAVARASVQSAERAAERAKELYGERIVALSEHERAEQGVLEQRALEEAAVAAQHVAELDVELAQKRLESVQQDLQALAQSARLRLQEQDIEIAGSEARAALLEQDLRLLDIDREQSTLRAPIAGVVVSAHPRPADRFSSGDVAARVAPQGLVVTAQVPNFRIGDVLVGQAARVRLDAHDYLSQAVLRGEVAQVAPDALLVERPGVEPQSVFVVTIRLLPDALQGRSAMVGLGMTGVAEIVTARARILELALRRVKRKVQ
jgi:multidrug efflux pump subunit AcrA (membrane-fusion protein)